MDSYLLLLIIIPSATAFVDCRTACHTCREEMVQPEVLEVHCAMCHECKERRREKMLDKGYKGFRKGPDATGDVIVIKQPETSHFPVTSQHVEMSQHPEISKHPEISHYAQTTEPEGCPVQPACSDSEEVIPPEPIKKLLLTVTSPPTTTVTTTTTTTTTRKPCPTFKPCKKRPPPPPPPSLPLSLPQPLPPPLLVPPPVPIAPPSLYPAPCYMQTPPMYPCPSYPYMAPGLGPMPAGVMAPQFHTEPGSNYQTSRKRPKKSYSKKTHGRYDSVEHIESHENHGKYTEGVNLDESYGNRRNTDKRKLSENSGSAEYLSGGAAIVVVTGTPEMMNLKAKTKPDYVYMYVGVPKSILKN